MKKSNFVKKLIALAVSAFMAIGCAGTAFAAVDYTPTAKDVEATDVTYTGISSDDDCLRGKALDPYDDSTRLMLKKFHSQYDGKYSLYLIIGIVGSADDDGSRITIVEDHASTVSGMKVFQFDTKDSKWGTVSASKGAGKIFVTVRKRGAIAIGIPGESSGGGTTPKEKQASSVTITPSSKLISYYGTVDLTATVKPVDAVDKTVTWEAASSNASIADHGDGTCSVTCTGAGNVKVTAKTANNKKRTITLTGPKAASSVSLKATVKKLAKGDTSFITATVKPDNAIDKTVTWECLSGNATIEDHGNGTCTVTCTDAGTIKIRAYAPNNKKATISLTGPKKATGVSLKANDKTLALNGSTIVTATVSPKDALDKTVTWESASDNARVTDNGDGTCTVTCTGAGNVKVKATTVTGKSRTLTITGPKNATSVSVKKSSYKLGVGETAQPTATVNPKNVIDSSVTWSSEDPSIATVSSEGLITAVAPGKTYIYATAHNGKVGKCTITVK
ncbi:MAG: Ig-like domain-containing protein [Lachnospiraceae bacterium]|nr:Ig-like domain-containing protein [Lachnospiraceae bacterium]